METGDSIAGGYPLLCPDGTSFGRRWAMGTWINITPGVHVEFVGSQASTCHPGYDRHEGHGGFTIRDLSDNIAAYLSANPAQIAIFTVGVNDAKASGGYRSAAQMIADYRQLLINARAASPDIRILASEVIPPNGSVNQEFATASVTAQEFNALLPRLVAEFPADTIRIAHNGWFIMSQQDGLHPDVVVYLEMAWCNEREMWSWISARRPAATDAGVFRSNQCAPAN